MKKLILLNFSIFVSLFYSNILFGQERDTICINEVVISATQTERNIRDIPAQIDIIDSQEIENFPLNNIDDIIRSTANVYVNRSWGIFSKNASVTMRGLESSARTLVMVDGVPKNKISGGSVNWHNINPDIIEKIEIIKGPASALYGNNAMGGIMNIITKHPEENISGSLNAFYGSYNTYGGKLMLSGNLTENNKGFFWDVNGFLREGDGYIFEAPDFIDATDVKTYLNEKGTGIGIGYQFNKSNKLDISYDYFDEKRGAGRKVFEEGGSFESYKTNSLRGIYTGKIKDADIKAILYFNLENYFAQKESLNDYNEYKLLDSYSDKTDQGMWFSYTKNIINHKITIGSEIKSGDVFGNEVYRTSTDLIHFESKMIIYGFFIQDELNFFKEKIKVIAGLRNDIVNFYDGSQIITNPTKVTGFTESFSENFMPNNWNALSPKLALQYAISKQSDIYASYGVGFVPPKLKDLSQTGKINKGFRLANPELKPETLTNYELGYSQIIKNKLKLNTAVYYSIGKDFQYLIGNGDSIDTGGSSLKPILKSDNIAKIGIAGAEISINYILNKYFKLNLSYSYNYSKVIDFEVSEINSSVDLTDKYLAEVSPHLFYAGSTWKNKYFVFNINCNYVDEQYFDVENTLIVQDYFVTNIKISKSIKKYYHVYLDVQNIFDNEFVDRKGQLSPGRFIIGGIKFKF